MNIRFQADVAAQLWFRKITVTWEKLVFHCFGSVDFDMYASNLLFTQKLKKRKKMEDSQ